MYLISYILKALKLVFGYFNTKNDTGKTELSRFSYLDGYRGWLAITVVFQHSVYMYEFTNTEYVYLCDLGQNVGVLGFFVLSSFLLTYRLMKDIDDKPIGKTILMIIKYTIRRYLRIYVPFVLFYWISVKYIQAGVGVYISLTQHLIYGFDVFFTHLWTVPVEIKFYFIIPLICFVCAKIGKSLRYAYISNLVLVNILFTIYGYKARIPPTGQFPFLYPHIPGFLGGSILAIFYMQITENKSIIKYLNNERLKQILGVILVIVFLFQHRYASVVTTVDYPDKLYPGYLYVFCLMILMLFSASDSLLINIFNNSILRSFGKFSFGIYLYHVAIIYKYKTQNLQLFRNKFEQIVGTVLVCYIVGLFWFYLVENNLIKLADYLCKKLENMRCFREQSEILPLEHQFDLKHSQ